MVVGEVKTHQRIYLAKIGRKSEEEMENPDREILVMERFPVLHVTPFHEHGSLVTSHDKSVLLRALERLVMVVFWFEGSSEKTTEHNKKKKKQKWSRGVLCSYLFILA
ncbi:hypothetical protein SLA2020_474330 [Shorea laevis]